jgi:YD repeat-containing protein
VDVEQITYDAERDLLEIWFVPAGPVARTEHGSKGATLDYDSDGNLVVMHVPNATALIGHLKDPASLVMGPFGRSG